MNHERLTLPIDRDRALREYDELVDLGCRDTGLAAKRIGLELEDLERYIKSRGEVEARVERAARTA